MEKEFVDQLKTIPLTKRQYAALDLERAYIDWRIQSFSLQRKPPLLRMDLGDPLLNIVSNYDLTRLEIGPLQFDHCVGWDDDHFLVGRFGEGLLCVSRYDGSVQILSDVYRPDSLYNKAFYCACSSEAFLEALIPAAMFIERSYYDGRMLLSGELIEGMIQYCSELAGRNSEAFFRALIEGPDLIY
jgi:hypothetical protein